MIVSDNVDHVQATNLSRQCGIPLTKEFGKYLGAPMVQGRVTKQIYSALISKVQNRIFSWGNQYLSMAGRVTLIKSILSALPSYLMQTCYLPDNVVQELDKMIISFLWGEMNGTRKLHELSWDQVCLPKDQGGLGLRDTRKANFAFLAKLCWYIVKDKDCLWVELIKRKYLRSQEFMQAVARTGDSSTWRGILKGREILCNGLGVGIINGQNTKFWLDEWLPCGPLIQYATTAISEQDCELSVAEFCDEYGSWNFSRIEDTLPEEQILQISSIWINPTDPNDDIVFWKLESDGNFSTKSAYESQLQTLPMRNSIWNHVWSLKCPNKLRIFVWRLVHGVIPTAEFLHHRHMTSQVLCFRCTQQVETSLHALRDCHRAKQTWLSLDPHLSGNFFSRDLQTWIFSNCKATHKQVEIPWSFIFLYALWLLWYWRNCSLHDAEFVWPFEAAQIILGKAKEAWDVLGSFNRRMQHQKFVGWKAPEGEVLKLNVDGSVNNNTGIATSGGLVRDAQANWVCGFVQKIGIASILEAELWGILQGLKLCWNKGFRTLEVETDSAIAVKKIQEACSGDQQQLGILMEIKALLQRTDRSSPTARFSS
nr:hypothetical protein [Solanum melongena]